VPLCAIHHTENHATGNERNWWLEHKIDPLPIAEELWQNLHFVEKARASLKGANISTALPTMPSGIYCLIAIAKISRITLCMLTMIGKGVE
jgi:hypothetical protein